MSRPVSLVMHVAPWDWPALAWSLPSWALAADDILIAYEAHGRCWRCPQNHALHAAVLARALEAFAGLPLDLRDVVRALPYTLPLATEADFRSFRSRIEPAARNMASWNLIPGSIILAPDVDEWCLDALALRRWLDETFAGTNDTTAIRMTVVHDVLAVDGADAWVPTGGVPQVVGAGVTSPGRWEFSRSVMANHIAQAPVGVVHWRARPETDASRAYHDSYFGEGFAVSREGLVKNTAAFTSRQWGSDAEGWSGVRRVPLGDLGCPVPPWVDAEAMPRWLRETYGGDE